MPAVLHLNSVFLPLLIFVGKSPSARGDLLKVGAFNIKNFGKAKMKDRATLSSLVSILSRYDLVLVQEIRDAGYTGPLVSGKDLDVF